MAEGSWIRTLLFVLFSLIYYTFFWHRMQKLWPFYFFIKFLCKIGQISCFLIFLTSICSNISKSQRILIFEVFIIFLYFFPNRKGDPGGRGWSWSKFQKNWKKLLETHLSEMRLWYCEVLETHMGSVRLRYLHGPTLDMRDSYRWSAAPVF